MNKYLKKWLKKGTLLTIILLFTISFISIITVEKINAQSLTPKQIGEKIIELEDGWQTAYENYFQKDIKNFSLTASGIAERLDQIGKETKQKPGVIWVHTEVGKLTLFLITPNQLPIIKTSNINSEDIIKISREFRQEISKPSSINSYNQPYLIRAKKLHEAIIAPLEQELEKQKIDTILFCLGPGLRTLPFAALYDGNKFLTEKYKLARIAGFNLTPLDYKQLGESKILAMGASEFSNQNPLPGVFTELTAITPKPWDGIAILNEGFTLNNLRFLLQQGIFEIVHLATHADFKSGTAKDSYIQLSDTQLNLNQISQLNWRKTPVELLVLSACNTALGDRQAELGFAGLSVQAGVKSAIASLWYVSDAGTVALMTEFYQQLKLNPLKSEALQKTQIAMIKNQVTLGNGEIRGTQLNLSLPPELIRNINLSDPFYWAAFSLIGSPW
jgi:CHAT domain-containing protein